MRATDKISETCAWLDENDISYVLVRHPAVYTIEEMDQLDIGKNGNIAKNLFLRDEKGKRHFLVVLRGDKKADLRALGAQLGTRLSFASPERLGKYLNLEKGSVTPLGVLYDEARAVETLLDTDLDTERPVGVHPCDNTASVFLRFGDLAALLQKHGNKVTLLRL